MLIPGSQACPVDLFSTVVIAFHQEDDCVDLKSHVDNPLRSLKSQVQEDYSKYHNGIYPLTWFSIGGIRETIMVTPVFL